MEISVQLIVGSGFVTHTFLLRRMPLFTGQNSKLVLYSNQSLKTIHRYYYEDHERLKVVGGNGNLPPVCAELQETVTTKSEDRMSTYYTLLSFSHMYLFA